MMPNELSHPSAAATSIKKRRLGLILFLAVSAGTGFVWLLERHGSSAFQGTLQAKMTGISTPRAGKICLISVRAGQPVAPGDMLVQLTDPELEHRLLFKRREITEFEAEVARAKAAAEVELAWRRRDLQSEIFETQLKMASLSQEKLNKQVEEIAWKERLSQGINSSALLPSEAQFPFRPISMEIDLPDDRRMHAILREDAAAAAAETLTLQIALCEQRLKKLQALDQEIETKIRASAGTEVAEARLQGAVQELAAIEGQSKDLTVTSPSYGTLGELKLQPGDRVSPGVMLAEILDETQPHVVAQIPTGVAARLIPGSMLNLIFPNDQLRSGTISTIAPHTVATSESANSYVEVVIKPAGKLWPKMAFGSAIKVLLP